MAETITCDYCGGVAKGVPLDDAFASRLDDTEEREIDGAMESMPYSVKIHVRPAVGYTMCPDCANKYIVAACKEFRDLHQTAAA